MLFECGASVRCIGYYYSFICCFFARLLLLLFTVHSYVSSRSHTLHICAEVNSFLPDIINIGFSFNNFSLYFTIITILYLLYHKFIFCCVLLFFLSLSFSLCIDWWCFYWRFLLLCLFHSFSFVLFLLFVWSTSYRCCSFFREFLIYSLQIDEFKKKFAL